MFTVYFYFNIAHSMIKTTAMKGSEHAITSIGDFFMNVIMPTWCFCRGMRIHIWNYWRKKECENMEEKCAGGYISGCCPGQYAGMFVVLGQQ